MEADREHWLTPRKDKIIAKGKGLMSTFFVDPTRKRGSSLGSGETESKLGTLNDSFSDHVRRPIRSVNHRLIEWVVDLMMDDIKKIVSASAISDRILCISESVLRQSVPLFTGAGPCSPSKWHQREPNYLFLLPA